MADADASPPGIAELDSDDVVTVDTLNAEIAEHVESAVDLQHDYVVGDVSDCGVANGHIHFDLVFEEASIHCVLFGFRRDGTSTTPEDEMQVAVRGDLSYYEPRGQCSILVTDVVELGDSVYSRIYQENKQALAEDNLLADERKQDLPALPGTVGLVTSADSDARTDAVTAIHDRYPDVDIKLCDASVQGPTALEELLGAINRLDADAEVDVIVVTRGGGADKTLRVFNEAPLCRVIARTETPIAVGIGHENDRTLAEEVADRRVMTPTHAGEIVPDRDDLEADIADLQATLVTAYETAVETELAAYATALDNTYRTTVTTQLKDLETSLTHAAERRIDTRLSELGTSLEHAYREYERQREHERELEATVEQARDEARAEAKDAVATTRRHYRIALIILTLLVLILTILYFVQP